LLVTNDSARDSKLQADLGVLRAALRSMAAPSASEDALRTAFRQHRSRIRPPAHAARPKKGRMVQWISLAAVAALGAVVFSALWVAAPERRPAASDAVTASGVSATVPTFQPLAPFAEAPSASLRVVRVRIPLSSLAIVPGSGTPGSIEAELLVGEDGIARGIRFPPADVDTLSAAAD
jgi:hypothetical protein